MKILLLRNNVTNTVTLDAGIAQAKTWAETIGLDLEFTLHDIDFQFTAIEFGNSAHLNGQPNNGFTVNNVEIFQQGKATDIDFDSVVLVYDWTKIKPQTTNPTDSGEVISIPEQWYATYPEVFAEFLLHELCHMFFSESGIVDITHNQWQSNQYHNSPNETWYLYLLSTLKSFWEPLSASQSQSTPMIQQSTLDLLAQFEGLSLAPYQDVGKIWSIGYGSTHDINGNPVTSSTAPITKEQAYQLLAKQLQIYADAVTATIKTPLTQNQFDACCSLCYNIGVNGFEQSTVARECNAVMYPQAAQAFLLWDKIKGVVSQGLLNRRKIEMGLFLK